MRGKIIVIEGTDCSGKQTQSEMLCERLNNEGIKTTTLSFPNYDSPTGRIVGGPYLGKEHITKGWFPEGANEVPAKVASLYFAADRLYNIPKINEQLNNGTNVILDRYTTSNMGHQAGKIKDKEERKQMFKWLETLEFDLLGLPRPDIKVLLYMPYEYSSELKKNRTELDELEMCEENLINAENAYLEIAEYYNFYKINCIDNNKIRTIKEINDELYDQIIKSLIK